MNPAFRAIFLLALASTGLDAQAKPVAPCILTLEAKPAPADPSRTDPLRQPRCPIVIVYAAPGLSVATAPRDASKRGGRANLEAKRTNRPDAVPGTIALRRPVMHV